jgi:hypothetical protein
MRKTHDLDLAYVVRFVPTIPQIDHARALHAVVKFAWGRFGLRAVTATETLPDPALPSPAQL